MDDFASRIEALEHRWMRAWMARDNADMKRLAARDLIVLFGADRSVILDRPSWLDAATTRLRCTGYRFGTVYVRRHGGVAMFAARVEIDVSLDGMPLMSAAFFADVWRRSRVSRRWHLIERVITSPRGESELPAAIQSLQHWR
ncbi:DUF4440 domain-containing protein [Tsuneonella sp. HG249]